MFHPEPKIIIENEQKDNSYYSYMIMDELIDKLNLLNYDKEILHELKLKPLSRCYFMITKNPGEQFYIFSSLAAWLIRKTGRYFDQPQEYDDPNSTIANILSNARELVCKLFKKKWITGKWNYILLGDKCRLSPK